MRVIDSCQKLEVLESELKSFGRANYLPDFHFAIPQLTESVNRDLSLKLNILKDECGCFAGGLLMGISFIALTIQFFWSGQALVGLGWRQWLTFGGWLLASALAGKTLGLITARLRMIQLVHQTLKILKKAGRLPRNPSEFEIDERMAGQP